MQIPWNMLFLPQTLIIIGIKLISANIQLITGAELLVTETQQGNQQLNSNSATSTNSVGIDFSIGIRLYHKPYNVSRLGLSTLTSQYACYWNL